MNDYDILKNLGLAIEDNTLIFYDDDSAEHVIEFNTISDITFEKAYITSDRKLGFWLEKLFIVRSSFGIVKTGTFNEDYRNNYELEIELDDGRVLSRKVKDVNVNECEQFISELNQLISLHK